MTMLLFQILILQYKNKHKNTIHTDIYDKRDGFKFKVNNFPNLSGNIHAKRTHGIVISQLIRCSKACINFDDFVIRCTSMMDKLIQQFFDPIILKHKMSTFYDKYYHLIQKYDVSKLKMTKEIFKT